MQKALEAVVDGQGVVRLLEPYPLKGTHRALVVLVDEESDTSETAMLSEDALSDWNRPEEDTAWSHLQLPKSS